MTSQRTRVRMVERLRDQGIEDEVVLGAMSAIPRHIFVEEVLATRAYDDVALPINFGQTISSPYIVARMSELLRGGSQLGKVLEIGSGCGYQTAILAQFAAEVYSIERIGPLLTRARARLRELRLSNVRLKHRRHYPGSRHAQYPHLAAGPTSHWWAHDFSERNSATISVRYRTQFPWLH
jgi:protein-L-isoaspartate(D-aspartate) O-methyltransferase